MSLPAAIMIAVLPDGAAGSFGLAAALQHRQPRLASSAGVLPF